jgi:hypothetical protein
MSITLKPESDGSLGFGSPSEPDSSVAAIDFTGVLPLATGKRSALTRARPLALGALATRPGNDASRYDLARQRVCHD